ncbi:hypothetical protein E1286_16850 [Nonomuraea terrae]|uniref:Uncharacterized protein n=1 Tax=Nonomuraea terrae TaxID=2530383 RepID=A0A4R4YSV6_9ACTN|nr:hypothetical protein [Nonomuraea terrae]TDD47780.1 hypothetical protein E1286_16850 [Nonomuraea terrae]
MFKSGLIMAGVVGGLLLSGGSALAETWPNHHEDGKDNRKIIVVCGKDNIVGHKVEVTKYGLINLDTAELLSGLLLAHADDHLTCSFR